MKNLLFNNKPKSYSVGGNDFYFRRLNWRERIEWEKTDSEKLGLMMLVKTLVDQDGKPVFESPEELDEADSVLLVQLIQTAFKHNKIGDNDVDELKKN